jgi:hypothetical protein
VAVFIEARTEPFQAQREEQARNRFGRGSEPVRRPTQGFQLKEETYAVIRVMGSDGEFIPVLDAAGETLVQQDQGSQRFTTFWTNFFVQSVSEERHEKQQIVETFGESFIFFFGEAPRMVSVQGLLLNTADFNWRAEFWENYERFFRGTRLVERGARLYLIYDDIIVEGYMTAANATENTNLPQVINFSFQMFVTGYTNISAIGDPAFPSPPGEIDYTELSSYEQAIRLWETNRNLQRELSTKAVAAANRQSYLGSGAQLASTIRRGVITAGDPQISAFLFRAMMAIQQADAANAANLVVGEVARFVPKGNTAIESTRQMPLRSQIRDNTDEFIGGSEQSPSAQDLAAPLSLADRWLEADRSFDNGVLGLVQDFQQMSQPYWDMMGRAGRASQEIRDQGGHRNRATNLNQTPSVGDGSLPRPPILARDVPYGVITTPGELL